MVDFSYFLATDTTKMIFDCISDLFAVFFGHLPIRNVHDLGDFIEVELLQQIGCEICYNLPGIIYVISGENQNNGSINEKLGTYNDIMHK